MDRQSQLDMTAATGSGFLLRTQKKPAIRWRAFPYGLAEPSSGIDYTCILSGS